MKGFKIQTKEKIEKVAIKNGMLTINIFTKKDSNCLYIGGVDYIEKKNYVWADFIPISLGDKLSIELSEIDETSVPSKVTINNNIESPTTKLENFRNLESYLKKEGVL